MRPHVDPAQGGGAKRAGALARRVHVLVQRVCRVAGTAGMLVCAYALVDPSIMGEATDLGPMAPPSPRWRAAFGLVFSACVLAYGMRPHAHRNHQ